MKIVLFYGYCLMAIAIISFSACRKTPVYPELEQSAVDSLRQTRIPGVFIVGGRHAVPRPKRDASLICPSLCATQRVYWMQVTYPVTICNPPNFDLEVQSFSQARQKQDSLYTLLQPKKPYTQQVINRKPSIYNRLYCRTHSGPWIAEIKEEETCVSCGPGILRYNMTILGIPQDLSWSWWDSLDDIPEGAPFTGDLIEKGEATIDCDLSDLNDCGINIGGGQGGDGGHPALQGGVQKK